jgi:hypothetical protein
MEVMAPTTISQARSHEGARALLQCRRKNGDSKSESIRVLKRRLSDVVFRALLLDAVAASTDTELSAA